MNLKKSFLIGISSLIIPFSPALAGNLEDGIDLFKSGQYEKAIEKLNKAAKESPDNPEPHLWLYRSYEALLDFEKVFPEKKLYDSLKSKQLLKQTEEANKKAEEEKRKLEEENNKIVEETDEYKIVKINPSYLYQVIAKRNPSDEVRSMKFLEAKFLRELIDASLSDSDSLNKLYKDIQLKDHYGLATPSELILMNKAKADLLSYEIDTKKLDLSQESDSENKKIKKAELDRLIKEYNNYLDLTEKSINQPVYINSSPLSYEYFVASGSDSGVFTQILEDKKVTFKSLIDKMTNDISLLKKSVDGQEKDILIKKQALAPELLDVDIRTVEGDIKEKVALYQSLRDKLDSDKLKLKNLISESNLLINSYNDMNQTIKKIKPDYIIKDILIVK